MAENDRIMSEKRWDKRSIVFLFLPKVHLLDLGGPVQVFYESSNICNCPVDISFTSFEQELQSEQQLGIGPFKDPMQIKLDRNSLICVPGVDFNAFRSGELEEAIHKTIPWLQQAYKKGANLASICSGALVLAEAGLLNHRKSTCHWKCLDYFKSRYPLAKVQTESIYTEDRGIYTSAGMTTGIDLALFLLEKWYGAFVAARVAQEIVVPFRRTGGASQEHLYNQMQGGFHPAIFKAQEILLNQPEANPSLEQLAEQVHLSSRHLSRLFRKYTGKTIHQFRQEVRLELGKQLLSQGQYTVEEIASRCGYSTARQFRRLWKERYGVPPSRRAKI